MRISFLFIHASYRAQFELYRKLSKDARIDYSKILLLTTANSIDDISFDLQFSNRNYYSKVFLEKVGVTPVVFRAKAGILSTEK